MSAPASSLLSLTQMINGLRSADQDDPATIKACCATAYGFDLVGLFLGESYHPGGALLTRRLADRLDLRPGERVIDVAAGIGTTALLLAAERDVDVTGIDLGTSQVARARRRAADAGLDRRARFEIGDAERLPVADARFDAAVCECAFCTFPDKDTAAAELARPYDWLLGELPTDGVIVDVACGSAPLAARATRGWIGLDRNRTELDLAVRVARGRVLLADATSAPLSAGVADAVVCSMALMLFDDPGRVVAEMARLLRAGGRLVALLPATAPLTLRDRARYARLLAALRLRRLPFRHHRLLVDPVPPITAAGLTLVSADRRRFSYPLTEPDDARRWLRSLYLPGIGARRWCRAQRVVQGWTGSAIGVPLRRLVATRDP